MIYILYTKKIIFHNKAINVFISKFINKKIILNICDDSIDFKIKYNKNSIYINLIFIIK